LICALAALAQNQRNRPARAGTAPRSVPRRHLDDDGHGAGVPEPAQRVAGELDLDRGGVTSNYVEVLRAEHKRATFAMHQEPTQRVELDRPVAIGLTKRAVHPHASSAALES
jgi:hypothetical protein